jgi:hypothetical protein
MQRPEQHRINAKGELLLRSAFPSTWVVRKIEQPDDYGLDFEIEVFSDEQGGCHSTGFTFKVQLKSSGHSRYPSSHASVSVSLKQKRIAYYCHEVNAAVLVIHADVAAGRLFWIAPQLAPSIAARVVIFPPGPHEVLGVGLLIWLAAKWCRAVQPH